MKMLKKAAAVLLAAVLALMMLAGCSDDVVSSGGNIRSYETEQNIINYVNRLRREEGTGLPDIENDPELQDVGVRILEAFAAQPKTPDSSGSSYYLKQEQIDAAAGAKVDQDPTMRGDAKYFVSTNHMFIGGSETRYRLNQRANVSPATILRHDSSNSSNDEQYKRTDIKLGVVTREINGEMFVLIIHQWV